MRIDRHLIPALFSAAFLVVASGARAEAHIAGTWFATGSMNVPRIGHTATVLADGRVLVVGGAGHEQPPSAEIYDPASRTWRFTAPPAEPRRFHTATRLADGRVLVAGGDSTAIRLYDGRVPNGSGSSPLYGLARSVELFDPATETWTEAAPMAQARREHTATLLPDGRVLVAGGGSSFHNEAAVELYEPASGTWSHAGWLATPRRHHTANIVADGTVLVLGGGDWNGDAALDAESYNPATGRWGLVPHPPDPPWLHSATRLPDGRLLAVGVRFVAQGIATVASSYEQASGTWSEAEQVDVASGHSATPLPDGRIVFVGGANDGRAVVYHPGERTWSAAGRLAQGRTRHTAVALANGSVLVAGGLEIGSMKILSSAEVLPYEGDLPWCDKNHYILMQPCRMPPG